MKRFTKEESAAFNREMRQRQLDMTDALPRDRKQLIQDLEAGVRYVFGGNAILASQTEEGGQFKYMYGIVIGSTIMGGQNASLNPKAFSRDAMNTIRQWENEADDEMQVQKIRAK